MNANVKITLLANIVFTVILRIPINNVTSVWYNQCLFQYYLMHKCPSTTLNNCNFKCLDWPWCFVCPIASWGPSNYIIAMIALSHCEMAPSARLPPGSLAALTAQSAVCLYCPLAPWLITLLRCDCDCDWEMASDQLPTSQLQVSTIQQVSQLKTNFY